MRFLSTTSIAGLESGSALKIPLIWPCSGYMPKAVVYLHPNDCRDDAGWALPSKRPLLNNTSDLRLGLDDAQIALPHPLPAVYLPQVVHCVLVPLSPLLLTSTQDIGILGHFSASLYTALHSLTLLRMRINVINRFQYRLYTAASLSTSSSCAEALGLASAKPVERESLNG